ncbi:putative 2-dehydropantoate 2-reductase [Nemania sp. FL0916]|nr:putative 2-dehydropantoate 2-reductase [Nemania sp. FL0916]
MIMMAQTKARVLIVGTGGVGALAAYTLETGGQAEVTAVMRSNYDAVEKHGIDIDSIEHGHDIKGWRPTAIRKNVPNVREEKLEPFDFILVTTKNISEVPPSVADIIEPAVTANKTAIVLSQNGLNIEKPLIERFPTNPIISSISFVAVTETSHGKFLHDDADAQRISPFDNPGVAPERAEEAARRYVAIYDVAKKLNIVYDADVKYNRWGKLVYNTAYNSVAAVLRMDTARMRMSQHIIDDLIRPIMLEVMAAARANGVHLAKDIPEEAICVDPTDTGFKPSMCQDAEKGNFMEIETIVGEPLRAGEAKGVPMPTLRTIYALLKGMQLQVMEKKGLWEAKFTPKNPYQ